MSSDAIADEDLAGVLRSGHRWRRRSPRIAAAAAASSSAPAAPAPDPVPARATIAFDLNSPPPPDSPEDSSKSRPGDKSSAPVAPAPGDPDESAKAEAAAASACFECNICFDAAREPVVTPCGHLYCWSCIYRWLQQPLIAKECPICKGAVSENDVIPIYGRGGSSAAGNGETGVPPRPSGRRINSWRQQLLANPPQRVVWQLPNMEVQEVMGDELRMLEERLTDFRRHLRIPLDWVDQMFATIEPGAPAVEPDANGNAEAGPSNVSQGTRRRRGAGDAGTEDSERPRMPGRRRTNSRHQQ
ncbi:E3 ubiquitin-protein ligase RMA1 [Acorus gramineus]|uniref:E3 ubiquitin-protein ligase RMA n=1 Tax=Acorus gramineus TaxID=55184 RepID=A0AAV9AGP8_ACOGR|nr:E3 ubiquitin-protein ligase RMA1 [Acorus gramineus]